MTLLPSLLVTERAVIVLYFKAQRAVMHLSGR